MARRKNTPGWARTNVSWDTKVLVWGRMAQGENDKQVELWLDRQLGPDGSGLSLHLDRNTVRLVRNELKELPAELAGELPGKVRVYWSELRKRFHELDERNVKSEQEAPKDAITAIASKIPEQVPSQVASVQPSRRQLTLDAPVVDELREEHGTRKRRHLVKAVNPRMTWCGRSLDGRIHLFSTKKIELCTCWHCRNWYEYAHPASGLLDSGLQRHDGTA